MTKWLNLTNIEFKEAFPKSGWCSLVDIGQLLPPSPLSCATVQLNNNSGQPISHQVEFLTRCANAQRIRFPYFNWNVDHRSRLKTITLESWKQMVKKNTWPDIRVIKLGDQKDSRWIDLAMDDATDEAVSYLLDFVPNNQLTEFDGAASGIGHKCALSLRRQHSSLSTLNLSLCPGVPSLAIQSILESFPPLVHLEVDHLNVQVGGCRRRREGDREDVCSGSATCL